MPQESSGANLSFSEAATAVRQFTKLWAPIAGLEQALNKAKDAELYMKHAHAENEKLKASVAKLKAEQLEIETKSQSRKDALTQQLADMEKMVRENQKRCDDMVRDATNAANHTIHELDNSKKAAERELTVLKEHLVCEAREAIKPEQARLKEQLDMLKRQIGDAEKTLKATEKERDDVHAAIAKMTSKVQQLVGA